MQHKSWTERLATITFGRSKTRHAETNLRWRGRPKACLQETPVGVEPTSSCFAGSRRAVWLQRHGFVRTNRTDECHSFSENSAHGCHGTPPFKSHNRSSVSSPGIEPGPRASRARMRIRHNPRTVNVLQHPAEESILVRQIRSLSCCPSHPQGILKFQQPVQDSNLEHRVRSAA